MIVIVPNKEIIYIKNVIWCINRYTVYSDILVIKPKINLFGSGSTTLSTVQLMLYNCITLKKTSKISVHNHFSNNFYKSINYHKYQADRTTLGVVFELSKRIWGLQDRTQSIRVNCFLACKQACIWGSCWSISCQVHVSAYTNFTPVCKITYSFHGQTVSH